MSPSFSSKSSCKWWVVSTCRCCAKITAGSFSCLAWPVWSSTIPTRTWPSPVCSVTRGSLRVSVLSGWFWPSLMVFVAFSFAANAELETSSLPDPSADKCDAKTEDAGLVLDAVVFVFLLLQKRIFSSWYFQWVVLEHKVQSALASRWGTQCIPLADIFFPTEPTYILLLK